MTTLAPLLPATELEERPWRAITKASMLLDGFSTAFWSPLAATILVKNACIPTTLVGLILAIASISNIPASSAISYLADHTGRHTFVNRLALFLPLFAGAALALELQLFGDGPVHTTVLVPAVMTTLVLLNCLGSAAVLPMLSAATMARLDSVGQKDQFGRFFVYRAIGWSTGSAAGGWLYQHGIRLNLNETMGMQSVHVELNGPVVVVLSGLVVFRGLQFALSLCLEFPTTVPPKSTDSNEVVIGRRASRDPGQLQQPGVRKDGTLSQLLCDRHVIIFLCSMAVNGVAGATYDNYVILFAKESLQADGLELGLMTTATGLANFIMWRLQPYLIQRLGPRFLLVLAMGSTVLRMWLYSIVRSARAVVAVQLLHGVSWVCIWSGATAFMHEVAPSNLRATAQGVLSTVYSGFGASGGLLLGGWLFSTLGAVRMFLLQGAVIGGVGVVYLLMEALPHAMAQRQKARDVAAGFNISS